MKKFIIAVRENELDPEIRKDLRGNIAGELCDLFDMDEDIGFVVEEIE